MWFCFSHFTPPCFLFECIPSCEKCLLYKAYGFSVVGTLRKLIIDTFINYIPYYLSMLDFIKHIFGKQESADVRGFKKLRKEVYAELKFLIDYLSYYEKKSGLIKDPKNLQDSETIAEIKKFLNKILAFTGTEEEKPKFVRYIVSSLSEVKEEYSQLSAELKKHASDITEFEEKLKELEIKEYHNLENFLNVFQQRLKPNLERQKTILSMENRGTAQLTELVQLIKDEGQILVQLHNFMAELSKEIVESIKITELPVDVRIPGSANVLTGFKDVTGTYLEKKSGGDKYPGKGVLIEQRSEYGGVLFSRLIGLNAPEIRLQPMTEEEMQYINTHDFVTDKENLSKIIFSKRMTVRFVANTKPLFDVRGEVEDVMHTVDPGYLFAFPPQSQNDISILFFLDVFISNYDRHGKNIMIDPHYRVFPIDPAMGFNTVDFVAKGFKGAYGYKFSRDIKTEQYKSFLFNSFTRYMLCVQSQKDLEWVYALISSKLTDENIKKIVGQMYLVRPEVEFLQAESGLYAESNKDLSPSEMASILIARRKAILKTINNWDSFSRKIEVFDELFADYMKRGRVSQAEYIPKHCTFRDHAMIRKVFYDLKKPITRDQILKEYYEARKKEFTAEDTVKNILSDYSTAHEEPCKLEVAIRNDYMRALKERDKVKRNVLSVVLNDIKYAELKNRDDQVSKINFRKRLELLKTIKVKLNEAQIVSSIQSLVKKNDELMEQAKKAKRLDVIRKVEAENEVLYKFLPRQLSDEELDLLVQTAIAENKGVAKPGQIIGLIMAKYKGKVDARKVNTLVNVYFTKAA